MLQRCIVMRIITALAIMGLAVQAVPAAEMKFYQLPPNAYPHDVAPAPDGTVWYTAQSAGFLGRARSLFRAGYVVLLFYWRSQCLAPLRRLLTKGPLIDLLPGTGR